MESEDRYYEATTINAFFDERICWWTDVYREDLPRGFFSFDMRNRLGLVVAELGEEIRNRETPDVLECGCGPGDIMQYLAPLPCRLTGLDINPRYLELAAEKAPGATLVTGNIEQLGFPDESFDIVYAVGVLMYLKDDRAALRELARVTRPGGVVLISVPNYYMLHLLLDPFYVYKALAKRFRPRAQATHSGFDQDRIRRYSLSGLLRLCRQHGLSHTRTSCSSFGPLRLWCRPLFPLRYSIRISELLRSLSRRSLFSGLRRVGNQLVVTLRKESAGL